MSDTRSWKCPECGHVDEITYDWLARHGGPICSECDCDLELQPAPDITAQVLRLAAKCEAAGMAEDALDETVHNLASRVGSDANNSGREEQIRMIVEGFGVNGAETEIDALIEQHRTNKES